MLSEVDRRVSISMTSRRSLKFSDQRCNQTLRCDIQLLADERDTNREKTVLTIPELYVVS